MLHLTIREPVSGFQEHGLTEVHSWRDPNDAVCAVGYVGRGAWWMRWPGAVCFRFAAAGDIEALPERSLDSRYIADLCRRTVMPLVWQARGSEALHASAVQVGGSVVAFCGERQTGKSTIAFALARRGYRQRADDSVVLQVDGQHVYALGVPFSVRLRPLSAAYFADAATGTSPVLETATPPVVPVSAFFLLRRVPSGEPIAERLTAGAAFAALLAHAHCFAPDDSATRRRVLGQYLAMAAAVPVYELSFAPGLDRLDEILNCIENVSAGAAVPA